MSRVCKSSVGISPWNMEAQVFVIQGRNDRSVLEPDVLLYGGGGRDCVEQAGTL